MQANSKRTREIRTVQAIAIIIVLMPLGGCQMLAGLGEDISTMANWSQNKIDHGFTPERQDYPVASMR